MIITNEPGFYKANEFGIRIENILTVKGSLNEKFLEF
jgi:Xaa-Pro aminopeptidase